MATGQTTDAASPAHLTIGFDCGPEANYFCDDCNAEMLAT